MSRKVADISECSEVNLIGSTVCCNGLQFHPFSSVLTGPIRRSLMSKFTVVKIWTFVFSGADISKHAQGPPPPLSPSPEIFVGLFSLKSCSKSQTERTAGSNIDLTMGRKILEMLLHEDKAKIVSMKDAKKLKKRQILNEQK